VTGAWLHAEGVTVLEKVPGPIVMPRGFRRRERRRRRRREPNAIIRDVTVRAGGGLSIVTGVSAATAALAAALADVVPPDAGTIERSHRPVAVLRARGRLIVDLRVRSAVIRELRLRGIPASRGRGIVDEVCRMVAVEPSAWASDLDRDMFLRLAPAAAVCSDAPIVILDGVFAGQPSDFDDVLLERLAERSRQLDLVTILCAPERRGIDEFVDVLEVQQLLALPRQPGDSRAAAPFGVDDEDEHDEESEDDRERIDVTEVVPPVRQLVTFGNVQFAQFGDVVETIDGRAPFTVRIGVTSILDGPTRWSFRLVHRAANVVLAAADGTSAAGSEIGAAVLDVPGGICSGKLALHARAEGVAGGQHQVVVQPAATLVPITIADDEGTDTVITGQLTFDDAP
jgi:ABC-type polysaccharide/polyol phosphate transport system ATPase subunit